MYYQNSHTELSNNISKFADYLIVYKHIFFIYNFKLAQVHNYEIHAADIGGVKNIL